MRIEDFWAKVQKTESCWLWTGAKDGGGYGLLYIKGRGQLKAHRLAYELCVGPIPSPVSNEPRDRVCVLHTCDTPACVNPAHLWVGTIADNNNDKAMKGRASHAGGAPFGEGNGNSRLTAEVVEKIRRAYGTGKLSSRAVGRMFGINKTTVMDIVKGKRWPHTGWPIYDDDEQDVSLSGNPQ